MGVRREGGTVHLEGDCDVTEAESLVALLCAAPAGCAVDVSAAGGLHTAVVQALLALAVPLRGVPRDPLLAAVLAPVVDKASA